MNICHGGGLTSSGTGIARYQRELVFSFAHLARKECLNHSLSFFTPLNRASRPHLLPNEYAFMQSRLYGKVQRYLNYGLRVSVESFVPIFQDVDLVHLLYPCRLITKKKVIATIHDVAWRIFRDNYLDIFSKQDQLEAESCIATADHLVANSKFTADSLIAGGVMASRVNVVYPGVVPWSSQSSCSSNSRDVITSLGLPDAYFLVIGAINYRKNISIISHAYSRPHGASLPPCVFVGPPPPMSILRQLGIDGSRLIHLGFQSEKILRSLILCAMALIFPSLYEGFGLPLLEAMASGLPVVASNIPVFREIGKDACLFFDPHSLTAADELAFALTTLYQDARSRRDLVERGLAVSSAFTWERSCNQLVSLYESVST